jgi:hypothetical protein
MESNFDHKYDFTKLGMKVGNIERFSRDTIVNSVDIDLISYYGNSGEITTLDFCKLELWEYPQAEENPIPVLLDTLTLPFNLKSVSSVLGNGALYSAILTNEGATSSLKLAVSNKKFSTKVINIEEITNLVKAEIFYIPQDPTPSSSSGSSSSSLTQEVSNTTTENLVIIGWDKLQNGLSSFTITVTVPTNVDNINDWNVA